MSKTVFVKLKDRVIEAEVRGETDDEYAIQYELYVPRYPYGGFKTYRQIVKKSDCIILEPVGKGEV